MSAVTPSATLRTHRWVVTGPGSQPGSGSRRRHAAEPPRHQPRRIGGRPVLCQTRPMPMRKFQHTVTADDTSARGRQR